MEEVGVRESLSANYPGVCILLSHRWSVFHPPTASSPPPTPGVTISLTFKNKMPYNRKSHYGKLINSKKPPF